MGGKPDVWFSRFLNGLSAAIWRYKPYTVSLTRYRQHEKMEECEKTDPRTDFHV
ncbi:hypothetical protein K250101E9_37320 [Enterocloster aldenensis]